jgi:hypothetical protein
MKESKIINLLPGIFSVFKPVRNTAVKILKILQTNVERNSQRSYFCSRSVTIKTGLNNTAKERPVINS